MRAKTLVDLWFLIFKVHNKISYDINGSLGFESFPNPHDLKTFLDYETYRQFHILIYIAGFGFVEDYI